MCHDEKYFTALYQIKEPIDVVLGDGHSLTAIGRGKVILGIPNGESLHDILYVPKLAYNLISVTKVSRIGKVVKFTKSDCYVLNGNHKIVVKATKVGSLY